MPSAAEEALKRAAGDALRLAHAMLPLHPLRLVALDQLGNALGEGSGGGGGEAVSVDLAFCSWVNVLWGVMGNESGLGESNPLVQRRDAWRRAESELESGARFDVRRAVAAAGRSARLAGGATDAANADVSGAIAWASEQFLKHEPTAKEAAKVAGGDLSARYGSGVEGVWSGGVWWPRRSAEELAAVPHTAGRPLLIGYAGEANQDGFVWPSMGRGLRWDIDLASVGEAIPAAATAALRVPTGQLMLHAKRASRVQHYGEAAVEDLVAKLAEPTSAALARRKARYEGDTRFCAFYHYRYERARRAIRPRKPLQALA